MSGSLGIITIIRSERSRPLLDCQTQLDDCLNQEKVQIRHDRSRQLNRGGLTRYGKGWITPDFRAYLIVHLSSILYSTVIYMSEIVLYIWRTTC